MPKEMAGSLPPVGGGESYFDPLGLATKEYISKEEIKRWRESELKHGRLAMLAVLGFIVGEAGSPLFKTSIVGPAIYQYQQAGQVFPLFPTLLITAIVFAEFISIGKGWSTVKETLQAPNGIAYLQDEYIPGDLGFDPLGLNPDKDTGRKSTFTDMTPEFKEMRTKELQNGRLAMLGIAGFVAQELVDHRSIAEHFAIFGFGPAGPR
jgi:hypothetical protein